MSISCQLLSFDRSINSTLLIDSIHGSNAKNTFQLPPPSSYFGPLLHKGAESVSLIRDVTQPCASKECLIIAPNCAESRESSKFSKQLDSIDAPSSHRQRERTIHFPAGWDRLTDPWKLSESENTPPPPLRYRDARFWKPAVNVTDIPIPRTTAFNVSDFRN